MCLDATFEEYIWIFYNSLQISNISSASNKCNSKMIQITKRGWIKYLSESLIVIIDVF